MARKMGFLFFGLIVFLFCIAAASLPAQSTVAMPRTGHLRRGINLSEWFAQVWDPKGYTKEHFQSWTTASDIALIRSLGFDHVRLSVNPQPMMDAERRQNGTEEYFGYLDAALKMILDAGLSVELDMHPESDFKARLAKDDDFVERFADFWRLVAKHYSSWDQERVFFEILNEPEMSDAYRWYGVETRLAKAIRQGAPSHTIIATGAKWDNNDDLVFLEPLRDANVIYVFHFYEPHLFTHQGATWGPYSWNWIRGLRYPGSMDNATKVAQEIPEALDRLFVIRYAEDHWDAARIDSEIGQASDWAKANDVPLISNEFGVYRKYVDPQDRALWIHDVRTSLERHNIGWAMWDYSGSFGLVTKQNGRAKLDEDTVKALGLR